MPTKQDLAKSLVQIDWIAAECDDAQVNSYLFDVLKPELLKLDKGELINFFFNVMQAKHCYEEYKGTMDNPFADMIEFKYLD